MPPPRGTWWKEYGQKLHFFEGWGSDTIPPPENGMAACGVTRKWELYRGPVPHLTNTSWCCTRCLKIVRAE